jgi:hypothetical protein
MIWSAPKLPWATILFAIVDCRLDGNHGGPDRPRMRAVRAVRSAGTIAFGPVAEDAVSILIK